MKTLIITPYVPYPLDSGGNQALFNIVDNLRNISDVSIILNPEERQLDDVDKLKKIWSNVTFYIYKSKEEQPNVRNKRYYKLLAKIHDSIARKMKRREIKAQDNDIIREKSCLYKSSSPGFDKDYADFVRQIANKGFDIIEVNFYEYIALSYVLPSNVKKIFVHHEIRYIRNQNEMSLYPTINYLDRIEYNLSKQFEYCALKQYDNIIVFSENDKVELEGFLGTKNILQSEAVVDSTNTPFLPFKTVSNIITFIGSGNHFPNMDAVLWFGENIIPELKRRNFEFTFKVIGKWSAYDQKIVLRTCPDVKFCGFVDNLSEAINGTISVVPIRIGSGMRMKILEIIHATSPFITTEKGVEGLNFINNKECLTTNDAVDFADCIIKLYNDATLQKTLSINAIEKFQQKYDYKAMIDKRMNIYKEICS